MKNMQMHAYLLLKMAVGIYKGDLLPRMDRDVWVVAASVKYRELYTWCMNELLESLHEKEQFSKLLTEVLPWGLA